MIPSAIRKQRPMAHIWIVAALSSLSWNLPTDELALANKLKSLDSSWVSLDFWLNVWTLVVVIGVVVELGVIVVEYRHEKRDFEGGIVHPPDKPSVLPFTFGLLGAGLVALGVAGEFRVHVKAGKVETEIRDTTRELVALVDDRAQAANERASLANERAEKEAKARTAMLLQLQLRDFTKKQMDDFVGSIKGKVTNLNVFTLPDPEAARYGFEVIDGLQRAGVKVAWYPTPSPYFLIPGIGSSGLTLYESPNKQVGIAVMGGFTKAGQGGQGMALFTPERPGDQDRPGAIPLSSIPSPALFIALKPPAFETFPGYLKTPALKAHKPPWE
jgi:hypothetical protein